ncbi:innexin inx2-like [Oratosquilla oratoria]|uniref:innexin inx2-like n=1 Tax=Oratosquilla oratoria TaxID=337810 RepID=UPI003F75999F
MAIVGHGGTDIIRQLVGNVVNIFKKKRAVCTSPCDGLIIKMHYQWTFWLLLAGFSCVWYSWYHRDVITCVSHFNAETQVRLDYINICLSYPYVEQGQDRRYLLFYRWIHWTLLVLAGFYYIPRKISKRSENPKVKKLIEDLAVNSHRYDQIEKELVDRAAKYIAFNLRTHNGLYYKFLTCNVVALIVDILSFQFLDFVFQGRFVHYGYMAYPYTRDPESFEDYMSRTFPPFAKCELGKTTMLLSKRTEEFGCHLTVMELYEKVFLGIWLWLILLTTMTCAYIIFLGFMCLPYFRLMMLKVAKPVTAKDTVSNTIVSVVSCCKVGDVYLLYRLKQHLSHARFYELMTRLVDPELIKLMVEDPADRVILAKNQDNLQGGRKPPMNMNTPKGRYTNPNDLFIQDYGGRPNTSILVE